jgi:hypothetical protein
VPCLDLHPLAMRCRETASLCSRISSSIATDATLHILEADEVQRAEQANEIAMVYDFTGATGSYMYMSPEVGCWPLVVVSRAFGLCMVMSPDVGHSAPSSLVLG